MIFIFLGLFASCQQISPGTSGTGEPILSDSIIDPEGTTIETRFLVPAGYSRIKTDSGSFGEYLRTLSLRPHGAEVRYFDGRIKWRRMTYDIPLQFYCNVKEFIKALDEKTLPGGAKYNLMADGVKLTVEEKKDIAKKSKAYRTGELAGKSR